VTAVAGPVLFARYAYPPNALGYCGPDDPHALLEYADAEACDGGLVRLARRFDGAWPYLALIAVATGRRDPLDPAVVTAYWIGNDLLDRVPPNLLAADLDDRFARRIGPHWTDLGLLAALGGRAHHNFHVFAVYPWVGMLRAERSEQPLRVLDSCRVRWGRVEQIRDCTAVVRSRPLVWDGHRLTLGQPTSAPAVLADNGYHLAPPVSVGDTVALHWSWICDVLDERGLAALRHYTHHQLALVNHALGKPVPAAALD
jgi:Family of unknown function (DUF6390)